MASRLLVTALGSLAIACALVAGAGAAPAAAAPVESAPLSLETYVAGGDSFFVTSTLILGKKDAILVDAQLTRADAHRLAARVLDSKRTLKIIYVTHAHPDHVLGLEVLTQAFPRAKVYASPKVIVELRAIGKAKVKQWKPVYGNNLADRPFFPSPYTKDSLELEGQRIELITMAPGESAAATILHIPALKAVIAGDLVYSGVHPWLAEANAARRQSWLKNLEAIKALQPAIVVAGHRLPDRKDLPTAVDFTAAYVRDFDVAAETATSAEDLQKKVEANYKDLQLPIILSLSAQSVFPTAAASSKN